MLVIRHFFDPVADALAELLGSRLKALVIESWVSGCAFTHTIGETGIGSAIRQGHGPALLDGTTSIVLNRVTDIPVPAFFESARADREYATAEANALFWSCLEGLHCPLLNNVDALRLRSQGWPSLAGAAHAASAGLATQQVRMTTCARLRDGDRAYPFGGVGTAPGLGAPAIWFNPRPDAPQAIWVMGDQVLGELDGVSHDAVRRFAAAVGLGFGTVLFAKGDDGTWRWCGFDPAPSEAPIEALRALAMYLVGYDRLTDHGECA